MARLLGLLFSPARRRQPGPRRGARWIFPGGAALLSLLLVPGLAAQPQSSVNLDRNPQLFAVLCALHAAGYQQDVSTAGFHPVRRRLVSELRSLQGPAVEELRQFYRDHRVADPGATLSRFISLALVVGPPPKFEYTLRRTDLPPDVRNIEGFNEVLARFYQEAQIHRLWQRVGPEYEAEIARLHQPLGRIVVVTSSYLREILNPVQVRTFSIFVEPMIGSKMNLRNYGDHYMLVLDPRPDLPLDEIRHAFLHFLLDPLALRYGEAVGRKEALLQFAGRAPQLPEDYKHDFPLLLTECLVRAVELRLDKPAEDRLAEALDAADRSGYVLVRPLYAALRAFEQAEPGMSQYFPDLVDQIHVGRESRRLAEVQFADAPAVPAHFTEAREEVSDLEQMLRDGEQQIALQDGVGAQAAFERALAIEPLHPRALYGLALAASMQGDGRRAREIFQQLVSQPAAGPAAGGAGQAPPPILAWSHVYLGRLYDLEESREMALSEYRAALAVAGAPESARRAAQRGLEQPFRPAAREPQDEPPRP